MELQVKARSGSGSIFKGIVQPIQKASLIYLELASLKQATYFDCNSVSKRQTLSKLIFVVVICK